MNSAILECVAVEHYCERSGWRNAQINTTIPSVCPSARNRRYCVEQLNWPFKVIRRHRKRRGSIKNSN